MKIKIPPYPNYIISNTTIERDVIPKSIKSVDSSGLSNQLIMIAPFKNGKNRVIRTRPVKHNNNLYISAFPNPIHLFLSLAVEHFDFSEQIKNENFPKCGKQYGKDIFILDVEENGTHDCYNRYVKYRVSSIIMLVTALESYLNHIIPNDFIYKTIRKNKNVEFNKLDIESSLISFREKLLSIIPAIPSSITANFSWKKLQLEQSIILELYDNRRNIIHLKTEAKNDFNMYFTTIDKMLDIDILLAIKSIIRVINSITPNFIEFE